MSIGKTIKDLIKALDAGFLIGLATTINLSCDNRYIGAFLFSIGLFIICCYQLKLCTGMFGYIFERNDDLIIAATLGNILGVICCFLLVRVVKPDIILTISPIVESKLAASLPQLFVSGLFCGILIFLAVDIFTYGASSFTKALGIFVCVPAFILGGFDHAIVTMFYACASNSIDIALQLILRACIILLGNLVGAVITCFSIRYVNIRIKEEKDK